jgi:HEAT repeat protein
VVITALAELGPDAKDAAPLFAAAVKDADPELRSLAVQALAKIGADPKTFVPALAEDVKDPAKRKEALETITKLGPVAKDAVLTIKEELKDGVILRDRQLVLSLVKALGAIGPDAKAAIPELINLYGENREVAFRAEITEAFGKIGKVAIDPLYRSLNDNNILIQLGAIDALGEIGPAARTQAVLTALNVIRSNHEIAEVRAAADKAFRRINVK